MVGAKQVRFNELLQACTRMTYSEVAASLTEELSTEAKIVKELQDQMKTTLANSLDPRAEANNNLVELHSVCTIQRRWLASSVARSQRNAKAKREAIRLRTPGTLVPSAFAGRVQHSTVNWGGRLFVFGGRAEGRMLRDFWEFSLNAGYWVDQSHTVPERMRPRCGHTAMLTGSSRMLIVGGHDGEHFLADVWECELNGLYWRQVGFSAGEHPSKLMALKSSSSTDGAEGGGPVPHANGTAHAVGANGDAHPPEAALERPTRTQVAAALTIQAHARGRQARVAAAWRNALADLEYDAASYVQALWRGFRARMRKGGAGALPHPSAPQRRSSIDLLLEQPADGPGAPARLQDQRPAPVAIGSPSTSMY